MAAHLFNPVYFYSILREKSYSSGLLKKIKLNASVVSVGNLQFGGSGKTPFVMFLLSQLKDKKIAVISQSYKANLTKPERIDLTVADFSKKYGDEPSLIKSMFPQVDVWCGPIKWQTAQQADHYKKYDFIILDDGFTHHKLARDLDIVLIDGSRTLSAFQLREPLTALSRSDLVLLTKMKSITDNQNLFDAVKQAGVEFSLIDYQTDSSEIKSDSNYLLFAGIGNFDFFKKNALDQNIQVSQFQQFENHCDYSVDKQKLLLVDLVKFNLRGLTTTKDKIKLTNSDLLARTDCLQIKVKLDARTQTLLETKLGKIFHAKNR